MAEYGTNSPPVGLSSHEERVYHETMQEFSQLQTWRNNFAMQWEEVAGLIMPSHRNTFMFGNFNWPGMKKTELQVDASGMMALSRFAAICDSLLTPSNMTWHGLGANDDYVMKDRQTSLWFEQVTRLLFKYRYSPNANFASQKLAGYQSLGAYGTSSLFVDNLSSLTGERGLRYKSVPLGEIFLKENHQGQVNGFIRWFRLTAAQARMQWPNTFPAVLQSALEQHSQTPYNFLHRVCAKNDYDPDRLGYEGMPYASYYISMEGHNLLEEGGYRTFPMPVGRYDQAPGEVYGRGPAMLVLPALKTLNAEKRTFLKQGHRAGDPVLLTADDGIVDFSMRPGAMNKGGMNSEGKPMVGILPTGNIQTTKEMMDEERSLINDAFLVSLFQILTETPTMSATEVIERVNEKGILIAPTMGRQQSEDLGTMIDRELDVLSSQHLLPPMPPRLREAKGNYRVVYTSPLSRAMRASESAGFMRSVDGVKELIAVTGDTSLADPFDFDTAIPAMAEINGTPASWMASDEQIANKRKARAQAMAKQQQIQAAPAAAAMMKAQVAQQQAGVQPPQPGQQLQQPGVPAQPGGF